MVDRRLLSPSGMPRSPSPTRSIIPGLGSSPIGVESVMMVKAASGEKGWEISFDEEDEEALQDETLLSGPDGVEDMYVHYCPVRFTLPSCICLLTSLFPTAWR